METLADEVMKEIKRVRDLHDMCKAQGPAGKLGAVMTRILLRKADKAIMGGDAVDILAALGDLRECK